MKARDAALALGAICGIAASGGMLLPVLLLGWLILSVLERQAVREAEDEEKER